jgi:hypothetical protein
MIVSMLFLSGTIFFFKRLSEVDVKDTPVTVPEKVVLPFFNITRAFLLAVLVPFPITNNRSVEVNEEVEVGV